MSCSSHQVLHSTVHWLNITQDPLLEGHEALHSYMLEMYSTNVPDRMKGGDMLVLRLFTSRFRRDHLKSLSAEPYDSCPNSALCIGLLSYLVLSSTPLTRKRFVLEAIVTPMLNFQAVRLIQRDALDRMCIPDAKLINL